MQGWIEVRIDGCRIKQEQKEDKKLLKKWIERFTEFSLFAGVCEYKNE